MLEKKKKKSFQSQNKNNKKENKALRSVIWDNEKVNDVLQVFLENLSQKTNSFIEKKWMAYGTIAIIQGNAKLTSLPLENDVKFSIHSIIDFDYFYLRPYFGYFLELFNSKVVKKFLNKLYQILQQLYFFHFSFFICVYC